MDEINFQKNSDFSQQSKVVSPTSAAANNPFLSSPTSSGNIVDLFGAPAIQPIANTKASDDLLQLGNPFADMFGSSIPNAAPMQSAVPQPNSAFVSDSNFSSVFGATEPAGKRCSLNWRLIFF